MAHVLKELGYNLYSIPVSKHEEGNG